MFRNLVLQVEYACRREQVKCTQVFDFNSRFYQAPLIYDQWKEEMSQVYKRFRCRTISLRFFRFRWHGGRQRILFSFY